MGAAFLPFDPKGLLVGIPSFEICLEKPFNMTNDKSDLKYTCAINVQIEANNYIEYSRQFIGGLCSNKKKQRTHTMYLTHISIDHSHNEGHSPCIMNSCVSKQPRAKNKETLLWSQLQDCKRRENGPCTITCELWWPEGGNLSSLLFLRALKVLSKYSRVPLNLSSNMLFNQHLYSQKIEGPLLLKVCLEENGGRWLTVHRTGK